jgi:hypothetical protein
MYNKVNMLPQLNSFLLGMANALDITGRFAYRNIVVPTDAEALASDWIAVGDDIRDAMLLHGIQETDGDK